ncbi:MAG: HPr kinase/phosphorylase [marine bacterium B5-7]|nr:MAG: HPr kinase/phosphorylase [marine bacterium B5-7]
MKTRPSGISIADAFHSKADRLGLVLNAGANGLNRLITALPEPETHSDYVDYLSLDKPSPVQIVDPAWHDRLNSSDDRLARRLRQLMEAGDIAMIVVSDDLEPTQWLLETGNQTAVCIYRSSLSHSLLFERLQHRAARKLARQTTLHGVFMSIRDVGVLISGPSGIGKSEVALDLIDRGSRLIADDALKVFRYSPYKLTGFCPEIIRGYLEVRGLGILDIADIYGNTAVLDSKPIDLITNLEPDPPGTYPHLDRLTPRIRQRTILGISVPEITLQVAPGRNLAVLIDAAVRTHIQFQFGKDPVKAFVDKQQRRIEIRDRLGHFRDDPAKPS